MWQCWEPGAAGRSARRQPVLRQVCRCCTRGLQESERARSLRHVHASHQKETQTEFLVKTPVLPLPASACEHDAVGHMNGNVRIVTDLRRTVNTTRARGAHVLHHGSAAAQDQSKRRPSSSWRDSISYKHGPRPAHTSSMTAILALSPCRGMVRTTRQ